MARSKAGFWERHWRFGLYVLGFVPAAWLLYQGIEGRLGADPVNTFERQLGLWAVRFLILSLLVTPVRQAFRVNLLRYRRMLGLLAYYYAALHLAAYLWLDIGFDWSIFLRDVTKRPFLIVGMISIVLLTPIAVTSNRFSIRRLGKNWGRLHRVVYLVAVLVGVHLFLSFKTWNGTSLLYDGILLALLLWRAGYAAVRRVRPARRVRV